MLDFVGALGLAHCTGGHVTYGAMPVGWVGTVAMS